jgi:hypothetical protein
MNYVRKAHNTIKDINDVVLPPMMTGALVNPGFAPFLAPVMAGLKGFELASGAAYDKYKEKIYDFDMAQQKKQDESLQKSHPAFNRHHNKHLNLQQHIQPQPQYTNDHFQTQQQQYQSNYDTNVGSNYNQHYVNYQPYNGN